MSIWVFMVSNIPPSISSGSFICKNFPITRCSEEFPGNPVIAGFCRVFSGIVFFCIHEVVFCSLESNLTLALRGIPPFSRFPANSDRLSVNGPMLFVFPQLNPQTCCLSFISSFFSRTGGFGVPVRGNRSTPPLPTPRLPQARVPAPRSRAGEVPETPAPRTPGRLRAATPSGKCSSKAASWCETEPPKKEKRKQQRRRRLSPAHAYSRWRSP